jgi:transcriptional regulator of NAD metabolism
MPEERKQRILTELKNRNYLKGSELAEIFAVTRQVIVKDIAIIRAEGYDIIATPNGYFLNLPGKTNRVRRVIATRHDRENIYRELEIIIDNGGKVLDVIVEHPVYGEIKANLMLDNRADLTSFMENIKNRKAKPLSSLTDGVHLHTVEGDSEEILERIVYNLDQEGFLIK